jgi:cell division protein FtsL
MTITLFEKFLLDFERKMHLAGKEKVIYWWIIFQVTNIAILSLSCRLLLWSFASKHYQLFAAHGCWCD